MATEPRGDYAKNTQGVETEKCPPKCVSLAALASATARRILSSLALRFAGNVNEQENQQRDNALAVPPYVEREKHQRTNEERQSYPVSISSSHASTSLPSSGANPQWNELNVTRLTKPAWRSHSNGHSIIKKPWQNAGQRRPLGMRVKP